MIRSMAEQQRSQSLSEAGERPTDFRTYMVERYQGEVFGEALFRALAERADGEARRKWHALEQLERETKEAIVPTLTALGLAVAEDPVRTAEGEQLGEALSKVAWGDLMSSFRGELEKFVAEFEAAEALAPTEHAEIARQLTRHEAALRDFVIAEIEGRGDASLEPVDALLREPSS